MEMVWGDLGFHFEGKTLRLFMVEVRVTDFVRSLAWYRDILGLTPLLVDEARGFALLGTEGGHIALKAGAADISPRADLQIVFEVEDVGIDRARLCALGEEVAEPVENPDEGYTEIRLNDPDGTPIRLFSWTGRERGPIKR